MKNFVLILSLIFSFSSFASSELLAEVRVGDGDTSLWLAEFELNSSKDRVRTRVVIEEEVSGYDVENNFHEFNNLINGLKYEAATKTVYVERGDRRIACGYFYNKPWVIDLGKSFRSNGNCVFVLKTVSTTEDNGFETYKVTKAQVYLEIAE